MKKKNLFLLSQKSNTFSNNLTYSNLIYLSNNFGVYLHIPFCQKICNYCDFYKVASYSDDHVKKYFIKLKQHLIEWLSYFNISKLCSIYFGGGTPGLFSKEYKDIFESLSKYINSQTEITLEVNPQNITEDKLQLWKDLGINRLSIGVQTFNYKGLKFLTRTHKSASAIKKIQTSQKYFNNINIDLIYGWQNQTPKIFFNDLQNLVNLEVTHISLYELSYHEGTALGKKLVRGLITPMSDIKIFNLYKTACDVLRQAGYVHEEISNWAKPGFLSIHNNLYWHLNYVIAVGAGAHGFVPSTDIFGLRYAYPANIATFLNLNFKNIPVTYEGLIIDQRNLESLFIEYISCALRTCDGINLDLIKKIFNKTLEITPFIQKALDENKIILKNNTLKLTELEWFKENAWSVKIIKSFK